MSDLKYPTIKDVRWRVDVSISTSGMARTMSPLVVCSPTGLYRKQCVAFHVFFFLFFWLFVPLLVLWDCLVDGNDFKRWKSVDI